MHPTPHYGAVQGLLLPRNLDTKEFTERVNAFIDRLPVLANAIETYWEVQDRETFAQTLSHLAGLLAKIYAKSLALEAKELIRKSDNPKKWDYVQQVFKPFINEVSALSVALQQVQNVDRATVRLEQSKEVEKFVITSKNVTALSSLLESGFMDSAKTLLQELTEYHTDIALFPELLDLLEQGDITEVSRQTDALIAEFNIRLTELVGIDLDKSVMSVDDMPEILSFVTGAIKNHYKVIAVPSGATALKALEVRKPDLFILDIDMPEMDGFELATRIRSMSKHAKTPIIFLTGNTSRDYIAKAMAVGADDFLVKPVSHGQLLAKVGSYLKKD